MAVYGRIWPCTNKCVPIINCVLAAYADGCRWAAPRAAMLLTCMQAESNNGSKQVHTILSHHLWCALVWPVSQLRYGAT